MDYKDRYKQWLNAPELDAELKGELEAIANDEKEQEERFYRELEFGTAGLRGIIGAGTNRMNVHIVKKATQGLAEYLKAIPDADKCGVAIAYDSRYKSEQFARETACVLAANGIKAFLFEVLHAVPQLSFALRYYKCIAGVVITASHNPPQYNGYKVYWEHGGQIAPDQADAVTAAIRGISDFGARSIPLDEAVKRGSVIMIGKEVDEAYYSSTQTLLMQPQLDRERGHELKLVYTPLHGSGNIPVRELLKRCGFTSVSVVSEQELPDSAFPTVSAPNPEDPDAFTLAMKLADKVDANAILATDPDSDRLGLAVRGQDGKFIVLTGNQIGSLLTYYILKNKSEAGTLPKDAVVVRSIVSTRLADAICADFNVEMQQVLTGFRFISEKIDYCEKTKERSYIFGFEESYGFLAGTFSRDKDAICASMLAAEATLYYALNGKTLFDVMQEIYSRYGYYKEKVASYTLTGKAGMEKIQGAMAALRSAPPAKFGGVRVKYFADHSVNIKRDLLGGSESSIDLPPADVLMFDLEGGAWLCIRPSGTEPKLKLYTGANAATEADVDGLLKKLFSDADEKLRGLLDI